MQHSAFAWTEIFASGKHVLVYKRTKKEGKEFSSLKVDVTA